MRSTSPVAPTPGAAAAVIARVCSGEPAVLGAYLFGSMVQPERCRQRDVDVAVWIDPDKADLRLPLRLANALEDGLGGKPVDVVVLNRAGQLLQYEVRRTGRLVFDRDPESRKILEIRARKRFEDFLYLHRRYAGAMLYGNRNGQTTSR